MKTIMTRLDDKTAEEFKQLANEAGISVSSLITAFVKQTIRTGKLEFNIYPEPTDEILSSIDASLDDLKNGRVTRLSNADDVRNHFGKLMNG